MTKHVMCGCRGTEVVEGVLRHHIGACFAALERRVMDTLAGVAPRLAAHAAAAQQPFPGALPAHPLTEVSPTAALGFIKRLMSSSSGLALQAQRGNTLFAIVPQRLSGHGGHLCGCALPKCVIARGELATSAQRLWWLDVRLWVSSPVFLGASFFVNEVLCR